MNTHVGAMPMAHLDRVTRAKPVTPVTIRQLLRVPLSSKLAGANLTIVLVAWVVGYVAHRTGATDWRVLSVMTVALLIGLVVNLALIAVALRPIRDLEETATRVWAGDLETRVPQSLIADAELAQVGGTLNFLLNALAEDRARVRMLASEVVRAGDRERSRVSKELHDSVAQSLAAIRYQLIAIEQRSRQTAPRSRRFKPFGLRRGICSSRFACCPMRCIRRSWTTSGSFRRCVTSRGRQGRMSLVSVMITSGSEARLCDASG